MPFGKRGQDLEPIGRSFEPLRPLVPFIRQRVERNLETFAIMVAHRFPHHLAHHVIAQIGRQIADPELAWATVRRRGQRLAINDTRGTVKGLRKAMNQFGLDVEVQQQIQKLLERIDKLMHVRRVKALVAQSFEVALDLPELAA